MTKRKTITKKLRFEVFKRDSFTCQYCGRMAPDIVLEVDHINPVNSGGDNDIMNLITSCFDCNRGKGKRKLSGNDEIKKQQEQLKQLNKKREQLKMMLDWRNELNNFENEQIQEVERLFKSKTQCEIMEYGKSKVKSWIKEFGLLEVLESTEISINQYFIYGNGKSVEKTFSYIPRICNVRKKQKIDPYVGKRNCLYAILRKRVGVYDEQRTRKFLQCNVVDDDSYSEVLALINRCSGWLHFWELVNEWYEEVW